MSSCQLFLYNDKDQRDFLHALLNLYCREHYNTAGDGLAQSILAGSVSPQIFWTSTTDARHVQVVLLRCPIFSLPFIDSFHACNPDVI
jgi:hypothetical protein